MLPRVDPKLVNRDFSATENFPSTKFSEKFHVQFRAEIFNLLNHTNSAPLEPNNGAGIIDQTGAAIAGGELNALTAQPGNVQFALKTIW